MRSQTIFISVVKRAIYNNARLNLPLIKIANHASFDACIRIVGRCAICKTKQRHLKNAHVVGFIMHVTNYFIILLSAPEKMLMNGRGLMRKLIYQICVCLLALAHCYKLFYHTEISSKLIKVVPNCILCFNIH